MKKFLAAILALAMIMAMAPIAFAADSITYGLIPGAVYVKEEDDDYYNTRVYHLAPGETGYIFIADYNRDITTDEPKSISIEELEVVCNDDEEDEVKKMITVDKKGEKKKYGDGDYGWFAKIKVKSVSLSNYPEDGYDILDFVIEYDWSEGDGGGTLDIIEEGGFDQICYEEGDSELEDEPMLFEFEKDDDVEIDLPDEGGVFEGVARKDFEIVAAMDTEPSSSLLNKYPNADIQFFNGNGANFPVTKGRLTIYADDDYYCYEVDGSKLIDRTSTYSSSEKGFYISTTKLGKYIISDTKLSGSSVSSSGSSTGTTTSSTTQSTVNTTAPVQTTTPTYRTYTVVKGDSLWSIAQRYLGNGWRYPEIVRLNNMASNFIFSGQTLWLPN